VRDLAFGNYQEIVRLEDPTVKIDRELYYLVCFLVDGRAPDSSRSDTHVAYVLVDNNEYYEASYLAHHLLKGSRLLKGIKYHDTSHELIIACKDAIDKHIESIA